MTVMADKITMNTAGELRVTDKPIIPFIEGDGIGVDTWSASSFVLDAVATKHGKKIGWKEVLASQKALKHERESVLLAHKGNIEKYTEGAFMKSGNLTGHGVFEAAHGIAAKYADQDKVNPGSELLSGDMRFEHLDRTDAADDIIRALEATVTDKIVIYDFARQMEGATEVKCSEFGSAIVDRL
jgi:isocitrate dehydrogenase